MALDANVLSGASVQKALHLLHEGYALAQTAEISPWHFAVSLKALLKAGCSTYALRLLVLAGLAEYKVRAADGTMKPPRPGGIGAEFPGRSVFILTDRGIELAAPVEVTLPGAGLNVPTWDSAKGELRFARHLVKRFRNGASNQRAILDAFQSMGWPSQLDNPLPQLPGQRGNRNERLHDAIKNLNKTLKNGGGARLLHFHSTDYGRAAGWRWLS